MLIFFAAIRLQRIFYHSLSGVGEGFTDLETGAVFSVIKSNSLFEANTVFKNGGGTLREGQNSNYNIWVNTSPNSRPMILECSNSASICTLSAPSTAYIWLSASGGRYVLLISDRLTELF